MWRQTLEKNTTERSNQEGKHDDVHVSYITFHHQFSDRVSILGESYHYFAIACSFLQLMFTLQFLHNFYMKFDVNE